MVPATKRQQTIQPVSGRLISFETGLETHSKSQNFHFASGMRVCVYIKRAIISTNCPNAYT